MTSDVTISSAVNNAQRTSASSAQLSSDFSDFLNLLTVQLQNQDPLSPMDSTEFTNQLVAFSGVEQQINANQKLDDLVALSLGNSFSSSLSYVGKDISYISSETHFDGEKPVNISYSIDGTPVDTTINILNEEGDLVFSKKVSDDDNVERFEWDGRDENGILQPAGTYQIRVDALDSNNKSLTSTTVVTGRVSGVESQNGSNFLLVGERAVSIGNVINVQDVNASADTTTSALGYVGKDISYIGPKAYYDGNTPINVSYTVDHLKTKDVTVNITDAQDNIIYSKTLDHRATVKEFTWDGLDTSGNPVQAGIYNINVDAINTSNRAMDTTTIVSGHVNSITTNNGASSLLVGTNTVPLGNVVKVYETASTTTNNS